MNFFLNDLAFWEETGNSEAFTNVTNNNVGASGELRVDIN